MRRRILACAVLLVTACTALTACGSSGGSGAGSTGGAAGSKTLTIGVVSDFTGVASSSFTTDLKGVQAYVDAVKSCQDAGLKSGYLNNQVPFGSTNVGPIALAMKAAGVDGLYLPISIATAFALVAALHQEGVKLKAVMLATGYGGDLLASKPTVAAAQGDDFTTIGAPAEANTAATKERAANLARAGVTGPPTFAEQGAYLTMVALGDGLKAAGANPTRASFMKAMDGIAS